jgi:tetratricopeptide (TPR) repeat protein
MRDARLLQRRLRDDNAIVRRYAEQGLWAVWTRSGDPAVDALMARAGEAMQAGRLPEAIDLLTSVTKMKPDFAEGWNRRATAYYLAGDYERSIADCAEVLKRNPGHFGALSGLGQIHARLENWHEALAWFRRALQANPNMESVEENIEQIEELLKEQRRNSI